MPTRSGEGDLRDFSDRGMHMVYLVPEPSSFKLDWEQVQGYKTLGFSLHQAEWQELMSGLIKEAQPDSVLPISYVLENPIPDFPFISRLSGLYEDAQYEPVEVDRLEEECLKAKTLASTPEFGTAIDKLLLICCWAKHLNTGIVFVSD